MRVAGLVSITPGMYQGTNETVVEPWDLPMHISLPGQRSDTFYDSNVKSRRRNVR
jgi:hypothetical protein